MRSLEIPGIPVEMTKGNPHIPMCKKIMGLDDYDEFVAMVISFAERKSMTISNIKEAVQEAIAYMENNATLDTDLNDQAYSETAGLNSGAGLNYYASHEEIIKCLKNARCTADSTQNKGDLSIDDCLTLLEDENISTKKREELLKSLPAGVRQMFSEEPINEPRCLKRCQYQKHGNQEISSTLDLKTN